MNQEILHIAGQLKDTFDGTPWYGRSVNALLSEVPESIAFEKPDGQHSILELVWHMINWREFTISCLQNTGKSLSSFEENDWRVLEHSDKSLWQKGLERLQHTQTELLNILQQQDDSILEKTAPERQYNFRSLLYGIIQHDIYHIGQIAYLKKLLEPHLPKQN